MDEATMRITKRNRGLGVGIALFGVAVLSLSNGIAYSNTQTAKETKPQPQWECTSTKVDKRGSLVQLCTQNAPLSVTTISPIEAKPAELKVDTENNKDNKSLWERVVELSGIVVTTIATAIMAIFTYRLWVSTDKLWSEAKASSAIAAIAANAAKESADVAVKSTIPFLSPYVTEMRGLHPHTYSSEPLFTSAIHFVFENFGKTPATIREVRAEIFVTYMDGLPKVDFHALPKHFSQLTVAGGARASDIVSVIEVSQTISMSQADFAELIGPAVGTFRRMALIGQVIYDDFLGYRHTRKFCVKMRLVPRGANTFGAFQTIFGGVAYNLVTTEKIPNPDTMDIEG